MSIQLNFWVIVRYWAIIITIPVTFYLRAVLETLLFHNLVPQTYCSLFNSKLVYPSINRIMIVMLRELILVLVSVCTFTSKLYLYAQVYQCSCLLKVIKFNAQEWTLLASKRKDEVFVVSRFYSKNTGIDNADCWLFQ